MATSNSPLGTRALQAAIGLGALIVGFGVPATATASSYPIEPPPGEVLPPESESGGPPPVEPESGGTPPADEVSGAVQAAALPQTGSELDGILALGGGALIAGLGISALAWRRRPLAT